METWQKNHIQTNLVELIKNTVCTVHLISKLLASELIDQSEAETLERPTLTSFEQSRKLYDILQTRVGSYEILIRSLKETRQSGALKILKENKPILRYYGCISYDKGNVLGKGSLGTKVYRGKFDGIDVAVKVLLCDHFEPGKALAEIKVLKRLSHENIVRYFFAEGNEDYIYIALELCAINLQDEVKIKLINLEAAYVSKKCATGLAHLHRLKIIHRDIKPANILLAHPNHVKLSDFGLSKQIPLEASSVTITGVVGTVDFMAPEILTLMACENASDEPVKMNSSSDIFSLGCVIFFALTSGIHPFGGALKRQYHILENQPQLGPIQGQDYWLQIISSMIAHDAKLRPTADHVVSSIELHFPKEEPSVQNEAKVSTERDDSFPDHPPPHGTTDEEITELVSTGISDVCEDQVVDCYVSNPNTAFVPEEQESKSNNQHLPMDEGYQIASGGKEVQNLSDSEPGELSQPHFQQEEPSTQNEEEVSTASDGASENNNNNIIFVDPPPLQHSTADEEMTITDDHELVSTGTNDNIEDQIIDYNRESSNLAIASEILEPLESTEKINDSPQNLNTEFATEEEETFIEVKGNDDDLLVEKENQLASEGEEAQNLSNSDADAGQLSQPHFQQEEPSTQDESEANTESDGPSENNNITFPDPPPIQHSTVEEIALTDDELISTGNSDDWEDLDIDDNKTSPNLAFASEILEPQESAEKINDSSQNLNTEFPTEEEEAFMELMPVGEAGQVTSEVKEAQNLNNSQQGHLKPFPYSCPDVLFESSDINVMQLAKTLENSVTEINTKPCPNSHIKKKTKEPKFKDSHKKIERTTSVDATNSSKKQGKKLSVTKSISLSFTPSPEMNSHFDSQIHVSNMLRSMLKDGPTVLGKPKYRHIAIYLAMKIVCNEKLLCHFKNFDIDKVQKMEQDELELTWLKVAQLCEVDFKTTDKRGMSLLMVAAEGRRNPTVLKKLVELGVGVDIQDVRGNTFLHYISQHYTAQEYHDIVKILISKGHGNAFQLANLKAETPLHFAFYKLDVLEQTLDCIINGLSANNTSTLLNLNAVDWNGDSILHWSVRGRKSLESVKLLVNCGVNLTACNNSSTNLAHLSASLGCLQHLQYFTDRGCNINAVDKDGNNALQCALYAFPDNVMEIVTYLLGEGADKFNKNKVGQTAYEMALLKGITNSCIPVDTYRCLLTILQ